VARYVLDTNLYIRATRDDEWNRALAGFVTAFAPDIYLHSVVAFELLAGALTPALQRRTHKWFIDPYQRRDRIITPRHSTWVRAAGALSRLVATRRLSPGTGVTKSFVNDCLLAASARDDGFILVTQNRLDFALLAEVLPAEVVEPWPRVPRRQS
jgi:predicted nucleic acid-binding protein